MKTFIATNTIALSLSLALCVVTLPTQAQSMNHGNHGAHASSSSVSQGANKQSDEWVKAEVVRVSIDKARVLLKHERIPSIDMDAMTMSFDVRDATQLKPLKPGDTVEFQVQQKADELMVTQIRRRP